MIKYYISLIMGAIYFQFGASAGDPSLAEPVPIAVAQRCREMYGNFVVPEEKLDKGDGHSVLDKLIQYLQSEVIGQSHAFRPIIEALSVAAAGLKDPRGPMATIELMGGTGIGKTETIEALVRYAGGDPKVNLIKLDGGEYGEGHAISKIIGSPPGYVGYGEKGRLSPEAVKKAEFISKIPGMEEEPILFIAIDEVEKMAPSVFDLLLNILDKGFVTTSKNQKVDLRHAIIFSTSNLGQTEAKAEFADMPLLKLAKELRINPASAKRYEDKFFEKRKAHYRPEYLGRWDAVAVYYPLEYQDFVKIAQKVLSRIQADVLVGPAKQKFLIDGVSEDLMAYWITQYTEDGYGARGFGKKIRRKLTSLLADLINAKKITLGDAVTLDLGRDGEEFKIAKVATGIPAEQLERVALRLYPDIKLQEARAALEKVKAEESTGSKSAQQTAEFSAQDAEMQFVRNSNNQDFLTALANYKEGQLKAGGIIDFDDAGDVYQFRHDTENNTYKIEKFGANSGILRTSFATRGTKITRLTPQDIQIITNGLDP